MVEVKPALKQNPKFISGFSIAGFSQDVIRK
jgi:hypothetical protein